MRGGMCVAPKRYLGQELIRARYLTPPLPPAGLFLSNDAQSTDGDIPSWG